MVFPVLAHYLRVIARDDQGDPYAPHCLRTLCSCLSQVFNADILYSEWKDIMNDIVSAIAGPSSQRKATTIATSTQTQQAAASRSIKLETMMPQCFDKFEPLVDWAEDIDTFVNSCLSTSKSAS
jgi:hypothetical protein